MNSSEREVYLLLRFSGQSCWMDLGDIIDHIACEADDFLEGYSGRPDARAGVSEFITLHYGAISPEERQIVTDAVMAILEEEGYFVGRQS